MQIANCRNLNIFTIFPFHFSHSAMWIAETHIFFIVLITAFHFLQCGLWITETLRFFINYLSLSASTMQITDYENLKFSYRITFHLLLLQCRGGCFPPLVNFITHPFIAIQICSMSVTPLSSHKINASYSPLN